MWRCGLAALRRVAATATPRAVHARGGAVRALTTIATRASTPATAQWTGQHTWRAATSAGACAAMLRVQRTMFIQTQQTPNPNSLKFIPGVDVLDFRKHNTISADFPDAMSAVGKSPLASELFKLDGVSGVFLGAEFVTVTKLETADWQTMKTEVFAVLMDHFTAGKEVLEEGSGPASDTTIHEDDSESMAMIKELLETRIRPFIQEDGGDLIFRGFDESTGKVFLELVGACRGCSSSAITLKNGIESMLMHYVTEVEEVVNIDDGEDEEDLEARKEFDALQEKIAARRKEKARAALEAAAMGNAE